MEKPVPNQMWSGDITGRDDFILSKGLMYGVFTIESQPQERQEWSDRRDMLLLLEAMVPDARWRLERMNWVRSNMGLEPLSEVPAPDDLLE